MGYSYGYEVARGMLTDIVGDESPLLIARVLGDVLAGLWCEDARRGAAVALAEALTGAGEGAAI
jgi:hypothetical protein